MPTPSLCLPSDVLGLGQLCYPVFPGSVSQNSRPDLPPTAMSLPLFGGIVLNSAALPEPRLAGLYPSRSFSPLLVSPRPIIQESLLPQDLGLVGFYYGLAYRLFGHREWVCVPLLVVSTVGCGCFSFRLGIWGGFGFVAFKLAFSSPCSFNPLYQARFSLSGRVSGF